jgi:glycolate oxidase iron-sulfur subunit
MPASPERDAGILASLCVKCGACAPACPVFAAEPGEERSPRGRLALLEAVSRGALPPSRRFRDYLENCLLCGACKDACPAGVDTVDVFLRGREEMAGRHGMAAARGLVLRHLLGAVSLLKLAMKTGWLVQRLAFSRIPSESGLFSRIPLPQVPSDRCLPAVARHFFTESFDGVVREGDGPRVGIFAGCMTNYFYPEIGEATVRLLGVLDATVVVPTGQTCCGLPALSGGERKTAVELALRNLSVFEGHRLEAVVTACASCGGNLKRFYRGLLAEAGVSRERSEAFISRVHDAGEFLVRNGLAQYLAVRARSGGGILPVTWHQPCHLGRLQGVREAPLELLRSLPGVALLPLPDAGRCCGMGGSYSLAHYDIARRINDLKIRDIRATGARLVVTSCPGCILHIRDGLQRHGMAEVEVLHLAELVARALAPRIPGMPEAEDAWEVSAGCEGYEAP